MALDTALTESPDLSRACPKGGKGPKIRHGSALAGAVNGEAVRVLG